MLGAPPAIAPPPAVASPPPAEPVVVVLDPPPVMCAEPAIPPVPVEPVDDTAALTVRATKTGVALETRGATAGRVIQQISKATGLTLVVRGWGARVRIFARIADLPRDAVIRAIAESVGMVVVTKRDVVRVLDAALAVEEARHEHASRYQLESPMQVVIPAAHPVEVARLVAKVFLSCGGTVMAVSNRKLLLSDYHEVRSRIEVLVKTLDHERPGIIDFKSVTKMDRQTWGIDDSKVPRCEPLAQRLAASTAGTVVLDLTKTTRTDVVVGCGGDRPAHVALPTTVDAKVIDEISRALDLVPHDKLVYTTQGIAFGLMHRPIERGARHVRAMLAADAKQLVPILEATYSPRIVAAAYEPTGLLFIAGELSWIEQAERLVEAWGKR